MLEVRTSDTSVAPSEIEFQPASLNGAEIPLVTEVGEGAGDALGDTCQNIQVDLGTEYSDPIDDKPELEGPSSIDQQAIVGFYDGVLDAAATDIKPMLDDSTDVAPSLAVTEEIETSRYKEPPAKDWVEDPFAIHGDNTLPPEVSTEMRTAQILVEAGVEAPSGPSMHIKDVIRSAKLNIETFESMEVSQANESYKNLILEFSHVLLDRLSLLTSPEDAPWTSTTPSVVAFEARMAFSGFYDSIAETGAIDGVADPDGFLRDAAAGALGLVASIDNKDAQSLLFNNDKRVALN